MPDTISLAQVFRGGFDDYAAQAGPLPPEHYKAANAILACRTAALGGHQWHCEHCSGQLIAYNSCRNRHCPSCQAGARAKWVDARLQELLPVPYFHVVFTLPAQLNPFALRNKAAFYAMLFEAASQSLLELGRDTKRLGAQMGFIAVLHTWGQNLQDHPHLHCVVPAGGLAAQQWVNCRNPDFLLPLKPLAKLFAGKFLALFKQGLGSGSIALHGALGLYHQHPQQLRALLDTLYRTNWVVYAKPPFAGAKAVVKYLGRYTHRIAIANSRIVRLSNTHVWFRYKDYADSKRQKVLCLTVAEFLRRFLLHVLPTNFVRIRYFGFLSCRTRTKNLHLCRECLAGQMHDEPPEDTLQPQCNRAALACPHCGSHLLIRTVAIDKPYPGGQLSAA